MADRVPERVQAAVDLADPEPDARVLEIGCGPGVGLALLARRLVDGHATGLDRSATAIERAERRLRRFLEEGRVDLQHRELSAFHGDGRPYDVVLGVDLTLFWVRPAAAEVERVVDLLAPDGVVHLVFSTPPGQAGAAGEARRAVVERRAVDVLGEGGLAAEVTRVGELVCVTARH